MEESRLLAEYNTAKPQADTQDLTVFLKETDSGVSCPGSLGYLLLVSKKYDGTN